VSLSGKKVNAMVLAAGFGTRLRPLTEKIPKPMIPLGNISLLENIFINLKNAGVNKIAVNTHYLGNYIANAIQQSPWFNNVHLFHEKEILGTGGPIVNAASILKNNNAFLLHNGDIFSNVDLKELLDFHFSQNNMVSMLMIDGPENKVAVNNGKVLDILNLLGRQDDSFKMFTYSGIAVFSNKIFDYLPEAIQNCSIITAILNLMKDFPNAVGAYCPEEGREPNQVYWNDLGTLTKYIKSLNDIKNKKIILPVYNGEIPMPLKSIPLPGASDRYYFRLQKSTLFNIQKSEIIACSDEHGTDEFYNFITYAEYFKCKKIPVPDIYSYSDTNLIAVMQDLGNDTIFTLAKKNNSQKYIFDLYKKIIDFLINFQIKTYDDINIKNQDQHIPEFKLFDKTYFRWETQYFSDNFLNNFLNIYNEKIPCIEAFFDFLAETAFLAPKTLIHRDFQSQNIIIHNNEVKIIDFQGARIGHFLYDLMSLVHDPYINLSWNLRKNLIDYYYNSLKKSHNVLYNSIFDLIPVSNEDEFFSYSYIPAMQRIMQAIGAYSFLALNKNKKSYIDFIPPALSSLEVFLNNSSDSIILKQHSEACTILKKIICTHSFII
jgi:NDP-sugar pyrophosphorylase family protein/thiamine kinase-like enzyme